MKLNFNLPILSKSEYHYLIDTEEFELHPGILYEDSIIVYEYTSSLFVNSLYKLKYYIMTWSHDE